MIVEYWSDITCPFCYIAETRLKKALKELGLDKETKVTFKAFELIPQAGKVPKRNMVESYARHYYISLEDARARIEYINQMGRSEGLDFNYHTASNTKTFDALRLAKFSQTKGPKFADAYIDRLYRAFFSENVVIADHAVLKRLSLEMGMTEEEVDSVLGTDAYADAVHRDEAEARGLSAVPFILINRKYGIPGAVDTSDMKRVLQKAFREEEAESVEGGMVCDADGCHLARK